MRLGRSVGLLRIGDCPSGMGSEIARECALGIGVGQERSAVSGGETASSSNDTEGATAHPTLR